MSAFDLTGRVAVVTGAGPGGLGAAAARSLTRAGATVVVSDHPSGAEALHGLADELGGLAVAADVAEEAQVVALRDRVIERHGRVDVLVHSAGVMQRKPTLETSLADWQHVVDVNLTGTWLVARALAEPMVAQGAGAIVTTSSVYAHIVGRLPEPAYYATKAGVANLTRGLAAEWGATGVRVNAVAPGVFYPTAMTSALAEDPGRLEAMTERTMLGRLGDPRTDIGDVVVFLASDAARYVTGQTLYVDGGWSAW